MLVFESDLYKGSLKSVSKYFERGARHDDDVDRSNGAFIDKDIVNNSFLIIFFSRPDRWWLLKCIIEVPQPHTVVTDSA